MKHEPEFASIETFVQFLIDDERDSFQPWEAQKVAEATRKNMKEIIAELKSYGLKAIIPVAQKEVRGVNSNPHDRFTAKNGFVGGCGIGNASRQMISGWQPR